jgi:ParB family chromosome partitioning protein
MSDDSKKRGLGRGLSALFGDESEPADKARGLKTVPIEHLHPGKYQPRRHFDEDSLKSLVDSVQKQGVLQPLLVRPHPTRSNEYEILAGERRWRAAQLAQLRDVPVMLREIADREALEIALVENVQRQDLTALEEAAGYQRLIDEFGHTQEALSLAIGKSRSHIANMLRLLALPVEVRAMLEDGRLTAGHARALLGADKALELALTVVKAGLNVRQTEALVKAAQSPKSSTPRAVPCRDADIVALERELSMSLGLKVMIAFDGKAGNLTFAYQSLDQLDEVLRRLRRS